jgi:putative peptidoglycan lipid II flippase
MYNVNVDKSFAKDSAVLALATLLSRVTGQLRAILLVFAIGATGFLADAFDIANTIPGSLNIIITGGIFNAILVPQFVKSKRFKNADERVNKLLTFSCSFVFLISLLLTVGAGIIITVISSQTWSPAQRDLAIFFGFLCMPQVFFYGLYTLLGQALVSRQKYAAYGFAPIANNVVSCIIFLYYIIRVGGISNIDPSVTIFPTWQILLLGVGSTFGIALQAIILIPALKRSGFKFKPIFSVRGFGLRTVAKTSSWAFLTVLIEQIAALWLINIISSAPSQALQSGIDQVTIGGNAAWTNALVIYIVPHSMITISLSTTLFTKISHLVASNNSAELAKEFTTGLRMDVYIINFFATFFIVMAIPLVHVLIPSTSESEAVIIGWAVIALSTKLMAAGICQICSRVFFAFEKTKWFFLLDVPEQFLTVSLSIGATLLLSPDKWLFGIGIATSIALWSGAAMCLLTVRYKLLFDNFKLGDFVAFLSKNIAICIILSGLLNLSITQVNAFMGLNSSSWWFNFAFCAVMTIITLVLYVGMSKLMRINEADVIVSKISQRLRLAK